MMELTFAEQVKILLKRRKMTIKDLADLIEVQTGEKNVPAESDAAAGPG